MAYRKRMQRRRIMRKSIMGALLFLCVFLAGCISAPEVEPTPAPVVQAGVSQDEAVTELSDAWNLFLVNAWNPLPQDYETPALTELTSGHSVDSRMYPALQRMMDDARAQGLDLLICSAYRSYDYQQMLYENKVEQYLNKGYAHADAEDAAACWVQRPGTSEHQIGLAVDIVDASYQLLDTAQEKTPAQVWLMEHCAEYGFILRYPIDKRDITGIGYEPWHYRYVGEEAAQQIMEQGICLEEYLDVN